MSEGAAKKEGKPRKYQSVRGTRDLLPAETPLWNRIEVTAHEVFAAFGFGEIRLPALEPTDLFARSIGLETDVVSKEMYTFEDYDTSQLAEFLENRREIVIWEDKPVTGPPGPMGMGARASFHPFFERVRRYIGVAQEALVQGKIPRTPENEKALRDLEASLEIFFNSIDSRSLAENRQEVNQIKWLATQVKAGDSLSLRPEATASVCRAYVEHGMQQLPQPVKLYYMGPMFRRERPQKGRYRQFYQIGAEVLGGSGAAAVDAEVIEIVITFVRKLGLLDTRLEINSIGDQVCRPRYIQALQLALANVKDGLGPDSKRRIDTNPLRVLDSKEPKEQEIIESLPRMIDYLCADCRKNYEEVKHELRVRDIEFHENWRLVRGLDYYLRTTFEVTASGLGSQNAICGGGRYDGLVELLGGPKNTKGVGFAIGEDRLIDALGHRRTMEFRPAPNADVMVVGRSELSWEQATRLASSLRKQGLRVYLPNTGTPLGKAMEAANRERIRVAVMVGESESNNRKYVIRILRPFSEESPQNSEVDADKIELYGRLVKLRNDLERKILGLLGESPAAFKGRALSGLVQELRARNLLPSQHVDELMNLIPILNRSIHGDYVAEASPEWALVVGNTILIELDRLSQPLEE